MSRDDLDQDVIERMLAGSADAFEAVVNHYMAPLSSFASRVLGGGSHRDLEDVVQEAFLRVWSKRAAFDARRASLKTWLFQIARNLALDHVRRRDRREVTGGAIGEPEASGPEMAHERGEEVRQVTLALLALPERQRSAIALCHLQGFSNREAAETLGVSTDALESLLARGRRGLRERLARQRTG